jgi:hypothetical protein
MMKKVVAGLLDTLPEDGTITSAQEQAVLDALGAAMPQSGGVPRGAPSAAPESS